MLEYPRMERLSHNNTLSPIPELVPVSGWKETEIVECGESLVSLGGLKDRGIFVSPQYFEQGIAFAMKDLHAREGVRNRLLKAVTLLPQKYGVVVWDAWRPLEVQQALFDTFYNELRKAHPGKRAEELLEETQVYVSLPSSDPLKPSPHFTGGAIDLSIIKPDGNPLEMGTPFDHFGIEASMRFFETTNADNSIRDNRRMLYWAMTTAGFSGYDEEWWHFDFGNQFHSIRTGGPAIYGGIMPPKSV
jgi:D-alanyl-D-alanine dipeptidase